ncbi:DUF1971 domain-containing protein [Escherichia coli]|nr:DUF1971 domain-containing protein [Escherichia coli]MBZ9059819.1 DUF1971 domain-containing protein [Escherichia coli]MBZ9079679.1 DUF1971 domain-containing protein [Escherichia coli]PBQ59416.1 hypothetical protein COD51_01185 [Escherichia coli]UIU95823.1 DUF1971 domain-containing protein [Escherichia coli]
MLQIPQNYIHTRSTPFWNKQTAPAGIFERHLDKGTRPGVYPINANLRVEPSEECDASVPR